MKTNLSHEVKALEQKLFVLKETKKIEDELLKKFDLDKFNNDLKPIKLFADAVNINIVATEEGCFLTGSLIFKPLEGCKIKKLSWKGYDSRGASRNDKALNKKVEELNELLIGLTGFNINVNSFSLEQDSFSDNKELRILSYIYIY